MPLIDFTETVYDLALSQSEWLPRVLQDGDRFISDGLGIAGLICRREEDSGAFSIQEVHVQSCPDDFMQNLWTAQSMVSPEFLWRVSLPTHPKTLSEASGDDPEFEALIRNFEYAKDGLGMSAFDPDGRGVYLVAPLRERTSLSAQVRERLQMVASHFAAGNRLRRALQSSTSDGSSSAALPHHAEAVLDANFRMTDAVGKAKSQSAIDGLREGARRIDRARGRLRRTEPEAALELWAALVRGRWSMVDWFDTDSRRYILAVPNAPTVTDPRGLTKKEAQVVTYLVAGHTNKLIGYRLGLSKARVSALVGSSMRKLGVRTRAQLVKKWRDFGGAFSG